MSGSASQTCALLQLHVRPSRQEALVHGLRVRRRSAKADHDHSLDWHLLGQQRHAGIQNLIRDLNRLYRNVPALHEMDCNRGFEWVITHDSANNIFAWLRKGRDAHARCLVVVNFSPNVYRNYRVRPLRRQVAEALNSDRALWRQQCRHGGEVHTGRQHPELSLTLPPLAAIFLVPES